MVTCAPVEDEVSRSTSKMLDDRALIEGTRARTLTARLTELIKGACVRLYLNGPNGSHIGERLCGGRTDGLSTHSHTHT